MFTRDGDNDCLDLSDEEGCCKFMYNCNSPPMQALPRPIIAGVSIVGVTVFILIAICCCIIGICIAGAASGSRRRGRTTYVGTVIPTTTATVVSTSSAAYSAGGYNYPI